MVSHRRRLCCLLLAVCCVPVAAAAREPARESGSQRQRLTAILRGDAPDNVAELRAMQARMQAVNRQVAPATVAIRVGQAHGSGVIINAAGHVLTAAHVAGAPNRRAEIRLHDGRSVEGRTLEVFPDLDAGLIQLTDDTLQLPFAEMGNSEALASGQWCLATGHPGGFESGRNPVLRLGRVLSKTHDAIRTDCCLRGGDSGGPLFDLHGRVVGIHSRIGEDLTLNLHVPVTAYRQSNVWEQLAGQHAPPSLPRRREPYIGVQGRNQDTIALVDRVMQDTPARKAGIRRGDIIIRFAQQTVTDFESLIELVQKQQPGARVVVDILRGEQPIRIELTVGERIVR